MGLNKRSASGGAFHPSSVFGFVLHCVRAAARDKIKQLAGHTVIIVL
jgi:hypothetical protein